MVGLVVVEGNFFFLVHMDFMPANPLAFPPKFIEEISSV
jgi:hypothetical protein